jgi:hypothetical protein
VDGHPTEEHLAQGFGKRGRAVSKHNAWCDKACKKRALERKKALIEQGAGVVLATGGVAYK